jgi:hypothetical protein
MAPASAHTSKQRALVCPQKNMLAIFIIATIPTVLADKGIDCIFKYDPLSSIERYVVPVTIIVVGAICSIALVLNVAQKSSALTECKWQGRYPIKLMTRTVLGNPVYISTESGGSKENEVTFYTLAGYEFGGDENNQNRNYKTEARHVNWQDTDDQLIPMSMPYLFRRLQLQWCYTLIAAIWMSINSISILNILVLDCRGGGYWQRIELVTLFMNIVYLIIVTFFSYKISKDLLSSTLIRGAYAVMCGSGIFKVSPSYKNLEQKSRFDATVIRGEEEVGKFHGRPIYYLDNIVKGDVHWTWMTGQERSLFVDSTISANRAKDDIIEGQNRLLISAGSAAIASIIIIISSMEAIDEYGVSSALYALALTFDVAVFAQTVGAYISFVSAISKNDACTKGIIAVNRDVDSEVYKWARDNVGNFVSFMGIIWIKEVPYSELKILQQPYRKNPVYSFNQHQYVIVKPNILNTLKRMT